jgi:hypothetical protein
MLIFLIFVFMFAFIAAVCWLGYMNEQARLAGWRANEWEIDEWCRENYEPGTYVEGMGEWTGKGWKNP